MILITYRADFLGLSLVPFCAFKQTLRRLCFQARSPFVSCLDEEAFSDLFARMQKQFVHWGHVVFQAGQPADTGMWILLRGRLGLFAQSVRLVFGYLWARLIPLHARRHV